MKNLSNVWKMVIGLGMTVVCLGGSYVAGTMIGEVVGEWIVNKLD